jgi:phosphoglucosamine mutase
MSENGIKFFGPMGRKFSEDVENEIEALLDDGGQSGAHGGSKRSRLIDGSGLKELYIRDLLEEHPGLDLSPISIVLDCANGAASYLAPEVFARAGARILSFHASPTGANINVLCGSEHLRRFPQDMRAQIERYQARFGLAFDGDADRVIIFDAAGNLIDGDYMLGILGKYFAGRQQLMARSVVTTTMRNMGLKLFLDELGLQMHETPVGDKYVIEKLEALRELDNDPEALGLGGEQSGHIIIMDKEHLTGDGIRSALFVIQALSDFDLRSVDELVPALVKMPQLIASAYVGSGPRLSRQELEAWTKQLLVDVPGMLRVNLRYSGTEPLFRIMLEVDDHYNANELAEIALEIARKGQSYAGLEDAPVDILHCG